jgi:hypothetical protein
MPSAGPTPTLNYELIADLIRRGLSRPEEVRAYNHENGFEKLTLGADPSTGTLLRAHFWGRMDDETLLRVAGNLHNHRWNFASMVLQGELRVAKFVESSVGDEFNHYQYWPESGDELEFIGRSRLEQSSVGYYGAGTKYHEPADEIHHASPLAGSDTVTVMARSASQRTYADVYTREARPEMVDTFSPLPVSRVSHLLGELNDLIGASRGAHS